MFVDGGLHTVGSQVVEHPHGAQFRVDGLKSVDQRVVSGRGEERDVKLLVERHETGVRYRHLFEKCVPLVEFGTERVSIMGGGLTLEYPTKPVHFEEYAQLVEA